MFKRFKQVFAVLFVLSAVLASVPAISANDSAFKTKQDWLVRYGVYLECNR